MIGSRWLRARVARERADERGDEVRPMAQRGMGLDAFDETVRVPGLGSRGEFDTCGERFGEQLVSVDVCPRLVTGAKRRGKQ